MTILHISKDARAVIEAAVEVGYPLETCGLLIGQVKEEIVDVTEAAQARNLNYERPGDRYELDPKATLTADRAARERGLAIVGVWHSHPDHPAQPSETDRTAAWEGWSYIILSVTRDGVQDVRSWRLNGEQFEEEEIRTA
jgi:proteasome lid subunit RPN8/RPN11